MPASTSAVSIDERRIGRWHRVVLGLIVLLAGTFRVFHIDATSVWCDELLSITLSNAHGFAADGLPRGEVIHNVPNLIAVEQAEPWWKVWVTLGGDVHPPLYYLALRGWRDFFGDTPVAIRSLSALLGTMAVVVAFAAGREMAGTAAGLWTAALNALAANHIYYSQEARMYALAMLFTCLTLWIVLRIDRIGFSRRRGVALGAFALGGMLTLYLFAPVMLATAVFLVCRLRGRAAGYATASIGIAALAYAIVWLPFFAQQHLAAAKAAWLAGSSEGHISTTFKRALLLPLSQFGAVLASSESYAYVFAVLYVLPAAFLRRRPAMALPWLTLLLVVMVPGAADIWRTTNMLDWPRYTVLLIPPVSLLIVGISWHFAPPRLRHLLPAAIGLYSTLALVPLYQTPRYDFRANALFAQEAEHQEAGRVVLASTWNDRFNSVLLLSLQYYWQKPPTDVVLIESVSELTRLPRDVVTDRVILVAGDRSADLSSLEGVFTVGGRSTWAGGVGTVHTLARSNTPASSPASSSAAPPTTAAVLSAPAILAGDEPRDARRR